MAPLKIRFVVRAFELRNTQYKLRCVLHISGEYDLVFQKENTEFTEKDAIVA